MVAHDVADLSLARGGEARIAWADGQMPVLRSIVALAAGRPHVTLDDGADLLTFLHAGAADLRERLVGGVEETTTGLLRARRLEAEGRLLCPVVAVNEAHAERVFNDFFGTGQST